MTYERVIKGIVNYINENMYGGMTDWQEILARIAVARMNNKSDRLKALLRENIILKELDIIDENGDVDVEGLIKDIRQQISEKGKISIDLPIFGKFTFTPSDVDTLHRYILEA